MFRNALSHLCSTAVTAMVLYATASPLYAADTLPIEPQLGLWEITTQVPQQQLEMMRMLPQMAEQMMPEGKKLNLETGTMSHSNCLSSHDIDKLFQPSGQTHSADCEKPVFTKTDAHNMAMSLRCQGSAPGTVQGTYTFNAKRDAFSSTQVIAFAGFEQTFTATGKRIGECEE